MSYPVCLPVTDRLRQMLFPNLSASCQICDRARYLQNSVISPGRQLHTGKHLFHIALLLHSKPAVLLHLRRSHVCIKMQSGPKKPLCLYLSRLHNPLSDLGAALSRRAARQILKPERRRLHTDVNPVQDGARYPGQISLHLIGRAAASGHIRIITARAWIHRYNELDTIQRCTPLKWRNILFFFGNFGSEWSRLE